MYVLYALKLKIWLRSNPVSKLFYNMQKGHRPGASKSNCSKGETRTYEAPLGCIMTILGPHYDPNAPKTVLELY